MSNKDFIDTRGLTKSFGWKSSETAEQQDVQEFLAVLFSALEHAFKQADESFDETRDLYNGKTGNYIRCKECGFESTNSQDFLGIQLPIKNEFGFGVINSSVEMAIENYLKPELLDGDNQYQCDTCAKKVDAAKGLKMENCPDLFMVSLNRFTIDYETWQRVKVTERVSFPLTLNMNDYMQGYEGIENKLYD